MEDEKLSPFLRLLLEAIESPSRSSFENFYLAFLEESFFVPRRYQGKPIQNISIFPTPFLDILGLQTRDENFVPIFTSLEELEEWRGEEPLEHLSLTGRELCKRTPEEWWITLNPAGETGKEFSPWEIERLRHGQDALDELIEDQLRDEARGVTLEPISEQQRNAIREAVQPLQKEHSAFLALFGALHTEASPHEHSTAEVPEKRYLFGVLTTPGISDDGKEKLHKVLQSCLSQLFIGDLSVELTYGTSMEHSPTLALFRFSEPILTKEDQKYFEKDRQNTPSSFQGPFRDIFVKLRNFFTSPPTDQEDI
ncbi:SseB family protein [bacterium]|nr:SseB family protein [bacterium]